MITVKTKMELDVKLPFPKILPPLQFVLQTASLYYSKYVKILSFVAFFKKTPTRLSPKAKEDLIVLVSPFALITLK